MCMQNDDALADTSVCASTSGTDVLLLRHELTAFKPQIQIEGGNQNLQSHAIEVLIGLVLWIRMPKAAKA